MLRAECPRLLILHHLHSNLLMLPVVLLLVVLLLVVLPVLWIHWRSWPLMDRVVVHHGWRPCLLPSDLEREMIWRLRRSVYSSLAKPRAAGMNICMLGSEENLISQNGHFDTNLDLSEYSCCIPEGTPQTRVGYMDSGLLSAAQWSDPWVAGGYLAP